MNGLEALNSAEAADAVAALLQCCGSRRWAEGMAAARPFPDRETLLARADALWWSLSPSDWLEAFRSHPRIGEQSAAAGQTEREQRWSAGEQAGVRSAGESTREALLRANQAYEARFAYIHIVCASGRTAEEMLLQLEQRLENTPEAEIRVAAAEQARITRIRLERLIDPHPALNEP